MASKKRYSLRRSDGRLIGVASTREEARAAAAFTRAVPIIEREDVQPITITATGQEDPASVIKALELLLSLTPEQCERDFKNELRRKLDQRFPGDAL